MLLPAARASQPHHYIGALCVQSDYFVCEGTKHLGGTAGRLSASISDVVDGTDQQVFGFVEPALGSLTTLIIYKLLQQGCFFSCQFDLLQTKLHKRLLGACMDNHAQEP